MSTDKIPKVSIGLFVYNGGAALQSAIESLLSQDYPDFELVISDNASTDITEEICRSYAARDNRIRYFRRDRNYGMNDNARYALKMSRGEYFLWAAHDDQWHPHFISAAVPLLDANPKLVLVSPGVEFFRPDGSLVNVAYPLLHTVGMGLRDRVAALFKEVNVGYNAYGLYRRDIITKINFQVDFFANDVVLLLLLMFHGEVEHLPGKYFRYRFVVRSVQEHSDNLNKDLGAKHPTKLYTILTINLLRALVNAPVSPSLKRIFISDVLEIIAIKNPQWRHNILRENPGLFRFVEPDQNGLLSSVEINVLGAFAALLLPYCYPGAPFEGAIDFAEIEGFERIPPEHSAKPAPGHGEFHNSLMKMLQDKRFSRALTYFDSYRHFQPNSESIQKLSTFVENFRPSHHKAVQGGHSLSHTGERKLRILFQNRPQTQSGWSSIIAQQLQVQLIARGHEIIMTNEICAGFPGCEIIHAFNLQPLEETEGFIDNALLQHVPFVMTTLFDDFPRNRIKAAHWLKILETYIDQGQRVEIFMELCRKSPLPATSIENGLSLPARYAHRLIASGPTEAAILSAHFPSATIALAPFGSSGGKADIPGTLFTNEYGHEDFVLCVGELTLQNNQLMLLKALEHEEIPLVFIDGGEATEPSYAVLCKKMKRKGPTLFTGGVSSEMLLSAYQAARVYCLPAWYENPGLMTLEAATQGCTVVASSAGCMQDLLGEHCHYCDPGSPDSIRKAIINACEKGPITGMQELAASFTWENAAQRIENIYYEVLQ